MLEYNNCRTVSYTILDDKRMGVLSLNYQVMGKGLMALDLEDHVGARQFFMLAAGRTVRVRFANVLFPVLDAELIHIFVRSTPGLSFP